MTHTPGPRVDLPGQMELPATDGAARRMVEAAMRPSKPQKPCDHGLFGDSAAQVDLLDLVAKR